ncbi:DUF5681 domain-containing protein [Maricaulaceae bacterium NA33B04]|nr:DUF5681 domain-containing protein [Maricaulaceae bacterium NA33B04]
MSDELPPHTAGYMKPPKSKRFKKGKSGNPRGGPKAIDDPSSVIMKVLSRRVAVAGSNRKVSMLEALTYKLRELALRGDKQAIKLCAAILKIATKDQPSLMEQKSAEAQFEYRTKRRAIWERLGIEYPQHLIEEDERDGFE